MAAITIDQRSALVLIDLQNGILALPTLLSPDDIKNRARRLAAAFRASTLPVVRVKLAFSADGGDLPPGRALIPGPQSAPPAAYSEFPRGLPASPRRHHPRQAALGGVHRNRAGPPAPPPPRDPDRASRYLHQHGRGIHSAERLGNSYNLIFAEDAITDVDAGSHTHTFTKIFPQLGEIATTGQIIDTLNDRSAGPEPGPAAGGSITRISRRSENAGL